MMIKNIILLIPIYLLNKNLKMNMTGMHYPTMMEITMMNLYLMIIRILMKLISKLSMTNKKVNYY